MTTQWVLGGLKRCSRCGVWKPPALFRPNERVSTGLSSWCKPCHVEAVRASREKYRDTYNAARRRPKQQRACELCGEEFVTSISTKRFCTESHRRAAERQRARETETPPKGSHA